MEMKLVILGLLGGLGSALAGLFGGWDASLQTLVIFMAIDYLSGMVVAGVFHASKKTDSGTLKSSVGWRGLFRKGVMLCVVLIACRLDATIGSNFIRNAVIIFYIGNETLSIVENAGLMGVPMPDIISKSIEALNKKG